MTYENIMFELNEGVGLVTFNRPKVLNALNEKTLSEVAEVIECARNDLNVRVLVFTGAGEKAFVAGADIADFPKMNPLQARLFAEKGQAVFAALERLPIPVIACVNGLFAETLPAGFSSQGSQLNLTNGAKVLYPASVDEAGDTVKKTVVKVIRKVPDSDGMVSETVHIRTADDSITEVRIVKDADIDVETEITTGVNINEDMIEHIETTIEHDSAGQKVIKKETVVIRHTNENQNSGKADLSNTLVIVDGVEQPNSNGLAEIDPDQIVSVDVIKDKTQMKKYTAKAYDGVIVITTKSANKK